MPISQTLKEARTRAGLTQEKVAETIHVSRQTVSNWETGRSYPDIASIIRLSDLYGLSLDELLKEDAGMIRHLDDKAKVRQTLRRLGLTAAVLLAVGLLVEGFVFLASGSHSVTLSGGDGLAIHGKAVVIYAALFLTASLAGMAVLLTKWRKKQKQAGSAGLLTTDKLRLGWKLGALALLALGSFLLIL